MVKQKGALKYDSVNTEHKQCIRLNHPYKSAVASHVLVDGYANITTDNLKLLKQVNDARRLDIYEAFYIQNDSECLNMDRGNIESCLFSHVK